MSSVPEITADDYTGEYTRTDGTPIYIVAVQEKLAAVVSGNVFMLSPTGQDVFELVGVAERVRFERDEGGTVTATADSKGSYPRKSTEIPAEVQAMFDSRESVDYT